MPRKRFGLQDEAAHASLTLSGYNTESPVVAYFCLLTSDFRLYSDTRQRRWKNQIIKAFKVTFSTA